MIDISKLAPTDIGRWVRYKPSSGVEERQTGRIKSWNEKFIFVVYNCGGDWVNFEDYTAAATRPEDLTLCEEQ